MPTVRASSEKVKISEIKEPAMGDLEVKVLDLWEPATEAISRRDLSVTAPDR